MTDAVAPIEETVAKTVGAAKTVGVAKTVSAETTVTNAVGSVPRSEIADHRS
jgi:hypothetical protein